MLSWAAWLLLAWGVVAAGYGVYAATAAVASQDGFHATQAGVALLIATVSVSAGLLVLVLGRLAWVLHSRNVETKQAGD